jgi:hypothetical protein
MSGQKFSGRLSPRFNPFAEDYLSEILEATAVAWTRMKQPSQNEVEDHITFRLAGRLANDRYFDDIPYDVVAQYWLLGLNGQRLGRLDLRFKHRYSQRDYFAFESKRLHVRYPLGKFSTEYSTYAGENGIMAFIRGYYSKDLPACGMLGYVMDGNSDKAWVGLQKRIEARRKRLRLAKGCKFVKSTLSKATKNGIAGTHLGETRHDLQTHELRIFHLVLPVRSVSGSAGLM